MAWEWVAPVATATAGMTGVFFTWLSGRQGRRHAETVLINQLSNSRLLAIDTRQQQRLENAYTQTLKEAEQVGHWAQLAYPQAETNPPQPAIQFPEADKQAETAALVHAFGSAEVAQCLEEWRRIVVNMTKQATLINFWGAGTSQNVAARLKFEDLRPQESAARLALSVQVAKELKATYQLTPIADPKSFPWKTGQDD